MIVDYCRVLFFTATLFVGRSNFHSVQRDLGDRGETSYRRDSKTYPPVTELTTAQYLST